MRLKTFFYEVNDYEEQNNIFEVGKAYTESDLGHEIIVTKHLKDYDPDKSSNILQVKSTNIKRQLYKQSYICDEFTVIKKLTIEELMDTAIYEGITKYQFGCRFYKDKYRSKAKATNAVLNRPEEKHYMVFDDNLCFENGNKVIVGKEYELPNSYKGTEFLTATHLKDLIHYIKSRAVEVKLLEINHGPKYGLCFAKKIFVVKELTINEIKETLRDEGVSERRINGVLAGRYELLQEGGE